MFRKRRRAFKDRKRERVKAIVIDHEEENEVVIPFLARKLANKAFSEGNSNSRKSHNKRRNTATMLSFDGDDAGDDDFELSEKRRRKKRKLKKKKRAANSLFCGNSYRRKTTTDLLSDDDSRSTRDNDDLFSGKGRYTQDHIHELKLSTRVVEDGGKGDVSNKKASPSPEKPVIRVGCSDSEDSDMDLKHQAQLARQKRRRKMGAQEGRYIASSREELGRTKLGQSAKRGHDNADEFDKGCNAAEDDGILRFGAYKESKFGGRKRNTKIPVSGDGFSQWERECIEKGSGAKVPLVTQILNNSTQTAEDERWNVYNRGQEVVSPSETRRFLIDSIHKLKQALPKDKTTSRETELKMVTQELSGIQEKMLGIQRKFEFFSEVQSFSTALFACLTDKAPMVDMAEVEYWELLEKRRRLLHHAKNLHYIDEWRELFNPLLDTNFEDKDEQNLEERKRRMECRERWSKRRKLRKTANPNYHPGWSSDEEPGVDYDFKQKFQEFWRDADGIFENVDPDFTGFAKIQEYMKEWRAKYLDDYLDAWIAVSFGKICKPFVKFELLRWNPFEKCHDCLRWYQAILTYSGAPKDGELIKPKTDLAIIPSLTAKVVLPTLTEIIKRSWNPFSQSQTDALMDEFDIIQADVGDYISPSSKKHSPERLDFHIEYIDLVQAIVGRLRWGVSEFNSPQAGLGTCQYVSPWITNIPMISRKFCPVF